jgi:predicted lipoprotein with Yx(FWY)xxD motif
MKRSVQTEYLAINSVFEGASLRRRMMKALVVFTSAALFSVAAFSQGMEPARVTDTSKGKALADAKGMTLYTFDRDAAGKSNCTGQCAQNWPPLAAAADAKPSGNWTIVTREGGEKQWAYRGKPLYTWTKDTKPGDVTGDGFNNVWRIAAP